MKRYDRISGVFWLLFGIFILVGAQNYSFGTFQEPGGGLYPTLLGILLIIMALLLLAQTRKASGEEGPRWDQQRRRPEAVRADDLWIDGHPFFHQCPGILPDDFSLYHFYDENHLTPTMAHSFGDRYDINRGRVFSFSVLAEDTVPAGIPGPLKFPCRPVSAKVRF